MQPVVDSIHELFVGVEALGSQPRHLGEEMVLRVVPGPDCKEGGRKSRSWRALLKHLWGPRVVVQGNYAFSEQYVLPI